MSFDEDSYGIGTAQQYYGEPDYWAKYIDSQLNSTPLPQGSQDLENQLTGDYWDNYIQSQLNSTPLPQGSQDIDKDLAEWSKLGGSGLSKIGNVLKNFGGKALNFAQTPQGIMALLSAFAALKDRQGKIGGGATAGMMAPRQYTRSVVPGAMGTPIVRYAANGGLMQAYASGGAVRPFPMQDGGFVMTKKAVDGAEKLADGGITSLLPDAKMIRGPGTGTSDDIPAYIQGPNGRTPAKLSNGEAYVPPGRDTKGLYALMHELEKEA
jgi:hypothetical protein